VKLPVWAILGLSLNWLNKGGPLIVHLIFYMGHIDVSRNSMKDPLWERQNDSVDQFLHTPVTSQDLKDEKEDP